MLARGLRQDAVRCKKTIQIAMQGLSKWSLKQEIFKARTFWDE